MVNNVKKLIYRRHRVHPGDAAFAVIAAGCLTAGLGLLLLPAQRLDGPALAAIYDTLPPRVLGVVWLVMACFPAYAVLRPSVSARAHAYMVLLPFATGWTGGLFIPVVTRDVSNFWAPLVWAVLTSLGYVTYCLVPLNSPFYRAIEDKPTPAHRGA